MSHPDPVRGPRWSRLACLALVVTLLVAACGSTGPSASPSASPLASPSTGPTATAPAAPSPSLTADQIYDTIEGQVADIRGLQTSRKVERQIITEDELRAMITEQFDKETPPEYLAANERLYKALGLIPAAASLRDLTLDLLGGGVVGFYRDDEKKLYVVSKSGAPGGNERFYFAHEYDHALQDQNFTVFKDQDGILDQSDRILARQSIYEGDATLLMTYWAAANLNQAQLLELVAASTDPEVAAVLARTPAILRAPLEFPYTTGFAYVQAANATGGWDAVNDFYDRMPESTEQILHPEKYAAAEAPVKVEMPNDLATQLGDGWTVQIEDTFGEFQLGIWLREGGVAEAAAKAAAAGWGGDRLAVVQGPNGAWGVVIHTVWDSAAEASEFLDAVQPVVDKLPDPARISAPGGKDVTIMIGSDSDALLALDVIFGATGV
jgi:hypothetical protein